MLAFLWNECIIPLMVKQRKQNLVLRVPVDLRSFLQQQADSQRRRLTDYCRMVLEDHQAATVDTCKQSAKLQVLVNKQNESLHTNNSSA